jgi:hypothetical protein
MTSAATGYPRMGFWRFSPRDAVLVALAASHAVVLAAWPAMPLIAIGLWWNSNTISHNFIHRPFFRSAAVNRLFSAALSVLLGIPQTFWRDRHLAHHAGVAWRLRLSPRLFGVAWRLRLSPRLFTETMLVVCSWALLASLKPRFFLLVYLPGYLAGLVLCGIQGHWEHATGESVSHYGRIYNFLCFNDGYHAEHHAAPGIHWTNLPQQSRSRAGVSSWPALLRWLDIHPVELLERLVLRSPCLQRFVLRKHRRAIAALLQHLPPVRRVTVVGGGLFPRTALILGELLPSAQLTILDSELDSIETARPMLRSDIQFRNEWFFPGDQFDCELTVVPLCLRGNREAVYTHPPSAAVLVHDWIWRRRGTGAVVSFALLKRINLVRP